MITFERAAFAILGLVFALAVAYVVANIDLRRGSKR